MTTESIKNELAVLKLPLLHKKHPCPICGEECLEYLRGEWQCPNWQQPDHKEYSKRFR
jgi:hypothetical protein